MTLKLVTGKLNRNRKQMYELPEAWEKSIDAWLKWLRLTGMMPNSIKLRRVHVRVIARRSATRHPAEITLAILVDLCGTADWSNDYRKGMRSSLISYFEWAVGEKLVVTNFAESLPRVAETPPNPRPAPDSIWFDLLDKAPPRTRLMARLAGEAGMRRAEVACAHYDDLLEDVYGYSLIVHGKGGKQRVVPITPELAKGIKAHTGHGYLFPGDRGRAHITPEYVGELVGDLMPQGWTMHKLRHRYASLGHGGTQNLRAVQEALGHASVATTQKYVAVSKRDIRAVSEAALRPRPDHV